MDAAQEGRGKKARKKAPQSLSDGTGKGIIPPQPSETLSEAVRRAEDAIRPAAPPCFRSGLSAVAVCAASGRTLRGRLRLLTTAWALSALVGPGLLSLWPFAARPVRWRAGAALAPWPAALRSSCSVGGRAPLAPAPSLCCGLLWVGPRCLCSLGRRSSARSLPGPPPRAQVSVLSLCASPPARAFVRPGPLSGSSGACGRPARSRRPSRRSRPFFAGGACWQLLGGFCPGSRVLVCGRLRSLARCAAFRARPPASSAPGVRFGPCWRPVRPRCAGRPGRLVAALRALSLAAAR